MSDRDTAPQAISANLPRSFCRERCCTSTTFCDRMWKSPLPFRHQVSLFYTYSQLWTTNFPNGGTKDQDMTRPRWSRDNLHCHQLRLPCQLKISQTLHYRLCIADRCWEESLMVGFRSHLSWLPKPRNLCSLPRSARKGGRPIGTSSRSQP